MNSDFPSHLKFQRAKHNTLIKKIEISIVISLHQYKHSVCVLNEINLSSLKDFNRFGEKIEPIFFCF